MRIKISKLRKQIAKLRKKVQECEKVFHTDEIIQNSLDHSASSLQSKSIPADALSSIRN